MAELVKKHCEPCERTVEPMGEKQVKEMLKQVDGWSTSADFKKITKHFKFKDFNELMGFITRVALVAEAEGHHPDFKVHGWNNVDFEISTHNIGGLAENDFIIAAKIDKLVG